MALFDYDRLFGEVRLDCNEPEGHAPNDDLIMQKAGDVAQLLVTELSNAPPGWSQRFHDLEVQPNQAIYQIPVEPFSKPVRVHTIDPDDIFHVTRKIEWCERQNVDEFYRGPTTAIAGWPKHTAMLIVLWWDQQTPPAPLPTVPDRLVAQVEIVPVPTEIAKYRFWYNTGVIPEPSKNTVAPIPAEWYRYWRVETSLLTLRYCHWKGRDQEARKGEIALIEPVLNRQSERFRDSWEQFKLTNRVSGSQEPSGYASWYLDGDPYL
jgi:hypothetical protein